MKIYLASPFFSSEEVVIYRQVIQDLRDVTLFEEWSSWVNFDKVIQK